MRFLVTGGAGFVGSNLALALRRHREGSEVIAFDNLRRRGSERCLDRLRAGGVRFVHGDVRNPGDLGVVGPVDFLIECSAEPSVLSAGDDARDYLLATNLTGAVHCAEHCKRHGAGLLFLSTSRVYPVAPLASARLRETDSRFELEEEQPVPGLGARGVGEDFPMQGARSFYGATKYAAETLLAEYADAFGLPVVIDRCGLIAGPWQFGKVDQGVVTYWLLAHLRGEPLRYIGYGGSGKQVRDVLHVDDLVELVLEQVRRPDHFAGRVFNVGGGRSSSVSLRELTALCREVTGRSVEIGIEPEARYADVPVFLTDTRRIEAHCGWRPTRDVGRVLEDVHAWLADHPDLVEHGFDG